MKIQSMQAAGLVILTGIVALLMVSTADARPSENGQRGGRAGNRPMFGEVQSIDGESITIAPVIPDFVKEMANERGIELPTDLPDEITIGFTDKTKWLVNGEAADARDFNVGDLVVISAQPGDYGQPTAMRIADEATAKQFIQSTKQFVQEGGNNKGGNSGSSQRGGHGDDRQRQRPVFGEIISLDGDMIAIRPEIPTFVQAKMDERGFDKEIELPLELSFSISEKTRYIVEGKPIDSNGFSIGDKVAVMGEEGTAFAIVDYSTVELKMSEMGDKESRGKNGKGNQKGRKGRDGKQRKSREGDNCPKQNAASE